jgi:hypothetical protein
MKIAQIILNSLSILGLLCTAICGLWLHSHSTPAPDPSSISFHMTLGLGTIVICLIALVLGFFQR